MMTRCERIPGQPASDTAVKMSGLLFAASCYPLDADGGNVPDKSGYTLFNPAPRELRREMSTDRPDKTESPYTVDAGHFQAEADILSYTYDRHNPARTDTRVETVS